MADTVVPASQALGAPEPRLTLLLLGPPQVRVGGAVRLGPQTPKALTLLAYLAVEGRSPRARSELAALFWPELPERQAHQDMRQALSRLRRTIDDDQARPPHLLSDPQTVQFNAQSDFRLDVLDFQVLVNGAQRHPHRRLGACDLCLSALTQAVEGYRGEFLAGLNPEGGEALDEWLLIQREHLQQQVCFALHALAAARLERGEPGSAGRYARRLLEIDGYNEAAQRLLLQAAGQEQGRNVALRQYEHFRRWLRAELGVEPEDETCALAAQIRAGTLPGPRPGPPVGRLPASASPLVGRQAELQALGAHLAGREPRLLTLYGPGGCGKTRLALEVAGEQVPLWRDGVWFIPLAEVPSPEALVAALALALGLPAGSRPLEKKQLLDWLRPRELLLVLDGFEHLETAAPLLGEVVRSAPEVRILVTSRTRLGLREEQSMPLEGLALPPGEPATVAQAEGSSAVQLFVQSARRVAPAFRLTPESSRHVARICRLVEGLPLGIELAAAWVRLYSCRQIADEIEASLDFLDLRGIGSPQGRHSLRGTFDYSYGLLPEAQQAVLRRLSVFRGGFIVEAARQVAGADPRDLDALLDRSLLQVSPARWLDLHLTVREYVAAKLTERPAEEAWTREQHGRFYLRFLQAREAGSDPMQAKQALDEIGGELANVRAAWHWAADHGEAGAIEASISSLSRFYELRTLYREAEQAFGSAADQLVASARGNHESLNVVCWLLERRAFFMVRLGLYAQLFEVAQAILERAQATGDVLSTARGAFVLGMAQWRRGEFEPAGTQLDRALRLAEPRGPDGVPGLARQALSLQGASLNALAGVCWSQGDHAGARASLEKLLEVASQSGDRTQQIAAAGNLGVIAEALGEYDQAISYYERALKMEQGLGTRRSAGFTNLGQVHLKLGAYAQAESYLQEALVINQETGARGNVALVLFDLCLLAHSRGEDEAARQYSQQGLDVAREVEDRSAQADNGLGLGHALLGLGREAEAAEAYANSLALRQELGQANRAMESLAGLARVALAQGRPAQAQEQVEEIRAPLETSPSSGPRHALDGTLSPFEVYLTCYRVLQTSRDPRAREILATAHELLQARAKKIRDPSLRRSFLENVAAHQAVVREYSLAHERLLSSSTEPPAS